MTGMADLVITLRCNSNWANTVSADQPPRNGGPGSNYEKPSSMPKDMTNWRKYIRQLVERYDGDGWNDAPGLRKPIKNWQLDNEILAQWKGTDQQFVELMRVTYETIKEVDPTAQLISPGITGVSVSALVNGHNERGWIYRGHNDQNRKKVHRKQILNTSKAKNHSTRISNLIQAMEPYMDVIDVHLYGHDSIDLLAGIKWIKDELRKAGSDARIWSLEFAAPFHEFSDERFNRYVITCQITAFHAGVERIFWSSLNPTLGWSDNYVRLSLIDEQGKPKTAFVNYALTAHLLEGFTNVEKMATEEGVYLYRFDFSQPRSSVLVGWTDERQQVVQVALDEETVIIEAATKATGRPKRRGLVDETTSVTLMNNPVFLVPAKQVPRDGFFR